MKNITLITKLKIIIVIGIALIVAGHSMLNVEALKEALGIHAYMLGAMCIAVGLICSLPTKIYLTILLMRHEGKDSKF